jgi:hypothetical protein
MEFWASSESHQPAGAALEKTRRKVEPLLSAAFGASNLATLQAKIYYVPIVMPDDMHARYPARSKLNKKQRTYDCAPILNYRVFVDGTFEDQLTEYVRGLRECATPLRELGALPQQIEEFEAILASVPECIMRGSAVKTDP